MQECEIQIRRPWKDEWEDIRYGEEVEIANILCHQCAGLDATKMNEKDFGELAIGCYREIVRKVGVVAGVLPLPVFNNKEYSLFATIDNYDKEKIWVYMGKSRKRIEYIYTGETIYES